jgi:hypothetical protein
MKELLASIDCLHKATLLLDKLLGASDVHLWNRQQPLKALKDFIHDKKPTIITTTIV